MLYAYSRTFDLCFFMGIFLITVCLTKEIEGTKIMIGDIEYEVC